MNNNNQTLETARRLFIDIAAELWIPRLDDTLAVLSGLEIGCQKGQDCTCPMLHVAWDAPSRSIVFRDGIFQVGSIGMALGEGYVGLHADVALGGWKVALDVYSPGPDWEDWRVIITAWQPRGDNDLRSLPGAGKLVEVLMYPPEVETYYELAANKVLVRAAVEYAGEYIARTGKYIQVGRLLERLR